MPEIDLQKREVKALRDSRPDLSTLPTSQLLARARHDPAPPARAVHLGRVGGDGQLGRPWHPADAAQRGRARGDRQADHRDRRRRLGRHRRSDLQHLAPGQRATSSRRRSLTGHDGVLRPHRGRPGPPTPRSSAPRSTSSCTSTAVVAPTSTTRTRGATSPARLLLAQAIDRVRTQPTTTIRRSPSARCGRAATADRPLQPRPSPAIPRPRHLPGGGELARRVHGRA